MKGRQRSIAPSPKASPLKKGGLGSEQTLLSNYFAVSSTPPKRPDSQSSSQSPTSSQSSTGEASPFFAKKRSAEEASVSKLVQSNTKRRIIEDEDEVNVNVSEPRAKRQASSAVSSYFEGDDNDDDLLDIDTEPPKKTTRSVGLLQNAKSKAKSKAKASIRTLFKKEEEEDFAPNDDEEEDAVEMEEEEEDFGAKGKRKAKAKGGRGGGAKSKTKSKGDDEDFEEGDLDEDSASGKPSSQQALPAIFRVHGSKGASSRSASLLDRFKPNANANIQSSSTCSSSTTAPGSPQLSRNKKAIFVDLNAGSKGKAQFMPGVKYTPMEKQVLELKKRYPDTLLMVECGYRYRFFAEDAEIAAKVLSIRCMEPANSCTLRTASIPVIRKSVHVRRLVAAGLKVGVVNQTETAALKQAKKKEEGKSEKTFERDVTAVYTSSTLPIDDEDVDDAVVGDHRYMICIYEENATRPKGRPKKLKKKKNDDVEENENDTHDIDAAAMRISLLALHPATGDLIVDDFVDDVLRSELETRLRYFRAAEFILPEKGKLSDATEKIIRHVVADDNNGFDISKIDESQVQGAAVRVERKDTFDYDLSLVIATDFFNKLRDSSEDAEASPNDQGLARLLKFPRGVLICIGTMITYLKQFNLDSIFADTDAIRTFEEAGRMILPASTLESLEVLRSQIDGSENGSLFWLLDHTATPFGARMLRTWITSPLLRISDITERLDAVEELSRSDCSFTSKGVSSIAMIQELFSPNAKEKIPDLERSLRRVYHKRCTPFEFLRLLQAFQKLAKSIGCWKLAGSQKPKSALILKLLQSLPNIETDIAKFLSSLSHEAAEQNDKTNLFVEGRFLEIDKHKYKIQEIQELLQVHLKDVRRMLNLPRLEYVQKLQTEYLIEVPLSSASKIPRDWQKVQGTKAVARYHTSYVQECLQSLALARDKLNIACENSWAQFLSEFNEKFTPFRNFVQIVGTLDCLHSLGVVAAQPGYTKPQFTSENRTINIKDGRHPVVESLMSGQNVQYVPNDTLLDKNHNCMILTGPNMGGKSSYIRQVAILQMMAQIGSFVPASSAFLSPVDKILVRIGASDNIMQGRSTFLVELLETSNILRNATRNSLVILDELGRGTSTYDGTAIAYATLEYIVRKIGCFTLFVTHYSLLSQIEQELPDAVTNWHMSYLKKDAHSIVFLYKLVRGVSEASYGVNVARMAGIPPTILAKAAEKSAEFKEFAEAIQSRQSSEKLLSIYTTIEKCLKSPKEELLTTFKELITT